MSHFLIRSLNIPSAEVALLKTIMRLSDEVMGSWTFVDEGRCDVLLVDGQTRDGRIGTSGARHVVRVGSRREPGPAENLLRPLRAEEFITLLNKIYHSEHAASNVAPSTDAPVATSGVDLDRDRKGMLKRWPAAALLAGDKSRIRMATFLSRAPQSVNRLAMLTGLSADHCEDFVGLLDSSQLIRWQSENHSTVSVSGLTKIGRGQLASDSSKVFLASIRRRLGLVAQLEQAPLPQ